MSELCLQTIHRRGGPGPLYVTFTVEGDDTKHSLDCDARDVQTFAKFQAMVADKLGLWVHHDQAEVGGRRGREAWNDEVGQAFDAGQEAKKGGCGDRPKL